MNFEIRFGSSTRIDRSNWEEIPSMYAGMLPKTTRGRSLIWYHWYEIEYEDWGRQIEVLPPRYIGWLLSRAPYPPFHLLFALLRRQLSHFLPRSWYTPLIDAYQLKNFSLTPVVLTLLQSSFLRQFNCKWFRAVGYQRSSDCGQYIQHSMNNVSMLGVLLLWLV